MCKMCKLSKALLRPSIPVHNHVAGGWGGKGRGGWEELGGIWIREGESRGRIGGWGGLGEGGEGRQSNLIVAEWIVTACCTATTRLINYICHRICISCSWLFAVFATLYLHCISIFDTLTCSTAVFVTTVVGLRAAVINCFCYKSFLLTNCPNLPIVGPESRGRRAEGNTNTQFKKIQTPRSKKYKHSDWRNTNNYIVQRLHRHIEHPSRKYKFLAAVENMS